MGSRGYSGNLLITDTLGTSTCVHNLEVSFTGSCFALYRYYVYFFYKAIASCLTPCTQRQVDWIRKCCFSWTSCAVAIVKGGAVYHISYSATAIWAGHWRFIPGNNGQVLHECCNTWWINPPLCMCGGVTVVICNTFIHRSGRFPGLSLQGTSSRWHNLCCYSSLECRGQNLSREVPIS